MIRDTLKGVFFIQKGVVTILDEYGFYRPNYQEILDDLQEKTLEKLGYDVNVSETGNIGKLLMIMAYFFDKCWEDLEGSYYSSFVSTAKGSSLDRIATLMGVSREMQQHAEVSVTFTGTVDTVIPTGFAVSTNDNLIFNTLSDATITSDGTVAVMAECEEVGEIGNVGAGSITLIVNPIADVTSVTNYSAATGGKDKENDAEFRERMLEGLGTTKGSTIDAMLVEILALKGVMSAAIISNDTDETVSGRPAHSFEAFVYGGVQGEIANAIFEKKPIGIQPIGTLTTVINDVAGKPHTIKFSRPTMKQVHVKATLTVSENFGTTDEVQTAIIKYIGGLDSDQAYYYGLKMNETCIYTKLLQEIMNVGEIVDVDLKVSTDGKTWVTTNITADTNEVLEVSHTNVAVTVS